jgi:hypothetical protein
MPLDACDGGDCIGGTLDTGAGGASFGAGGASVGASAGGASFGANDITGGVADGAPTADAMAPSAASVAPPSSPSDWPRVALRAARFSALARALSFSFISRSRLAKDGRRLDIRHPFPLVGGLRLGFLRPGGRAP